MSIVNGYWRVAMRELIGKVSAFGALMAVMLLELVKVMVGLDVAPALMVARLRD